MALNAYLSLKGQHQGDIKGGVTQKGREGQIEVIAADHDIVSPRDAASGLPTGKRMHKPFVITKEIDVASPLLRNAMTSNEILTRFTLNFWKPNVAGTEKNFYRVELTNARIVDIVMQFNNTGKPELAAYRLWEELSFVYDKITWTVLDPATLTATDNWTVAAS